MDKEFKSTEQLVKELCDRVYNLWNLRIWFEVDNIFGSIIYDVANNIHHINRINNSITLNKALVELNLILHNLENNKSTIDLLAEGQKIVEAQNFTD